MKSIQNFWHFTGLFFVLSIFALLVQSCASTQQEKEADSEIRSWLAGDHHIHSSYIRVRGTNSNEPELEMDPPGEDPWMDLWFYSNPVFIEVSGGH